MKKDRKMFFNYTIKLKFPPRMRKKFTNKKIWQILTIIKKKRKHMKAMLI